MQPALAPRTASTTTTTTSPMPQVSSQERLIYHLPLPLLRIPLPKAPTISLQPIGTQTPSSSRLTGHSHHCAHTPRLGLMTSVPTGPGPGAWGLGIFLCSYMWWCLAPSCLPFLHLFQGGSSSAPHWHDLASVHPTNTLSCYFQRKRYGKLSDSFEQ